MPVTDMPMLFPSDIFDRRRFINYLGKKTNLLKTIFLTIQQHLPPKAKVCDLFSGSGIVSAYLRYKGFAVHANDIASYSFIVNSVNLKFTRQSLQTRYPKIEQLFEHINNLKEPQNTGHEFFSRYYSENTKYGTKRLYFSEENGLFIDAVLEFAWSLNDKTLRDIIIADLLVRMSKHANVAGTFVTHLKKLNASQKVNQKICLRLPMTFESPVGEAFKMDAIQFLQQDKHHYDAIYIDPPYDTRQYSYYYFLLEQAARHPSSREIPSDGFVALKTEHYQSKYSITKQCEKELNRLISMLKRHTKTAVISYSDSGLILRDKMLSICNKNAQTEEINLVNRQFASKNRSLSKNKANKITEWLYVLRLH